MTREDAAYLDYLSAEQSERERIEHFNTATECDACGEQLGADRYDVDGFVIGNCCARRLAAAFLPEVLAVARAESRWG